MNNDQKTLVILTPGFPETEVDSTCLPMQQALVRSLKELSPELNIIILSFQYPYHTKTYDWFGTTVIPFAGKNKGGLSRLLLRRKLVATLKKINRANNVAGLLSFWYGECAWLGNRFADKYDLKHYCWILGQDARKENKYPARMAPKENELIALSDFIQDEFKKNHGIRPSIMIPAAIDTKQFSASATVRNIDILATGSLIPLKQYDIFLDIVADVKKQLPGIKVMLVGNGPEKEKLQSLIVKLGLQSTITLTGELSHQEVLKLMQRTKVFLHPSSYEGFGVVCLEALYGGAIVVSFVKPMHTDIKNWYQVATKKEMTQKTLGILQNRSIIFKPVTVFTIDDTTKKILKLFTT